MRATIGVRLSGRSLSCSHSGFSGPSVSMTGSVLFVGRRFWREGQMKAIVSFVCLLLAATCAAEESHVTVSTGGWVGSGVTNGWRFANLGAGGMMGAGSFIESPQRPEAVVLTVTIGLCCSTNLPNRSS